MRGGNYTVAVVQTDGVVIERHTRSPIHFAFRPPSRQRRVIAVNRRAVVGLLRHLRAPVVLRRDRDRDRTALANIAQEVAEVAIVVL